MIDATLVDSEAWERGVSNLIPFISMQEEDGISGEEIIENVAQHYVDDEGKRNIEMIGRLLTARANVKNYGGGDYRSIISCALSSLRLRHVCGELNAQLRAIAIMEAEVKGVLYTPHIESCVDDVADMIDDYLNDLFQKTGEFPKEGAWENVGHMWLSTMVDIIDNSK